MKPKPRKRPIGKVLIAAEVPAALRQALFDEAEREDRSASAIIRRALVEHFEPKTVTA